MNISSPAHPPNAVAEPATHRKPYPRTALTGIRLVRIVSAAVVAAIPAWSSYWRMVHVALHYGERREVAYVLGAAVSCGLTRQTER